MSSNESSSSDEQLGSDSEEAQSPSEQVGSRVRKPRTSTKWPSDKITVTEIGADGMPTEKKGKQRMRRLAGLIARERVSLVLPNFGCLTGEQKAALFEDYVMPFLEFQEDMRPLAFKKAMKMVAKSLRTHKSVLVNNYMAKGLEPFKDYKYMKKEDWEEFVRMKSTEEFKTKSEKYKKLRQKNKYNHHLGTTGYDGKISEWEAEDAMFASEGRPNPWEQYCPRGRTQNWLRGRGTLTDSGKITFMSNETKVVSEKIKQKNVESSEGSFNGVRENDILRACLENKEHPGRVRGLSSYMGWKHGWPEHHDMYRKRKKPAEVDVEKLRAELKVEVTQDVMAQVSTMLVSQGLQPIPMSGSPSPATAWKSSCPPSGVLEPSHDLYAKTMQVVHHSQLDSIDLQVEPTPCALVIKPGGYQIEVARGQVHPLQTMLHSIPILEGYVVVHVDFVHCNSQDHVLEVPSNDEMTMLGQALGQRIQWKKSHIVLNPLPMGFPEPSSALLSQPQPPKKGISKSAQIVLEKQSKVICTTSSTTKSSKMGKSVQEGSKSSQEPKVTQQKRQPIDFPEPSSALLSQPQPPKKGISKSAQIVLEKQPKVICTTLDTTKSTMKGKSVQEVSKSSQEPKVTQQKRQLIDFPEPSSALLSQPQPPKKGISKSAQIVLEKQPKVICTTFSTTKSTKKGKSVQEGPKSSQEPTITQQKSIVPVASAWTQANPKFKYGQPMLTATELQRAGPSSLALHDYCMKSCREKDGITIVFRRRHFLGSERSDHFLVCFKDLYDLFTLDDMDMSLLRCLTLCMIQETKQKAEPVGFLDPQKMSLALMQFDRGFVVGYVARALSHYAKKEYVMFAYNTGAHWILVVIATKWNMVLYLDSINSQTRDYTLLKGVLDEAFAIYTGGKHKLTHSFKFPCHQQPVGNTCCFYVANHMLITTGAKDLERPEDFKVPTKSIDYSVLSNIRERIASFLMFEVIDRKGEFHCAADY